MKKGLLLKNICIHFLIIILISLFIECFIYNFRFWESLTFTETTDYSINFSGIRNIDGYFYKIEDPGKAYVEIGNINEALKNIYFNPFSEINDPFNELVIAFDITDDAHSTYVRLPSTEIIYGLPESYYIRMHLAGKSEKIRINILSSEKNTICLPIRLNTVRPFVFHLYRYGIIAIVVAAIWFLNPASKLYHIKADVTDRMQLLFILLSVLVNSVLMFCIFYVFRESGWKETGWKANLQYNYMAESLAEGKVYLDFEVPELLRTMPNPYDPGARNAAMAEADESYVIDFAYFDGKYYSYFGIVPVILFYLPFYLITGESLYTGALIGFLGVIFVWVCYWFLYTLIARYFPNTSLGLFLLMGTVLVAGSEVTYCMQMSTIYSVPILMGILMDMIGVTCLFRAVNEKGEIQKKWLVAGAVSIALVIGCRPQLAIACLFAFPIFWKQIRQGLFFTKKGMANTACVTIPFLCIGSALMFYNYIRFNNFLDFGATYNLTGFDMPHRGLIAERFIVGFFEFLFQPFHMTAKFPYFTVAAGHMNMVSDFQGQLVNEPFIAGYFSFNLISIVLVFIHSIKFNDGNGNLMAFSKLSLFAALIIMAVDIQMVGLTQRYLTDFSVFLMIPTVIIILSIMNEAEYRYGAVFLKMVVLLAFLCILINYLTLAASGRYNDMIGSHPRHYYRLKYQLFSIFSIR